VGDNVGPMAKRATRPKRYLPVTRPKFTIYLRPDIRERAQNCVDYLSDRPERLTMTALIERALLTEVRRLERKYYVGKPFPARRGQLRRGPRA